MSVQLDQDGNFTWQGYICQPWEGWGQINPDVPRCWNNPECVSIVNNQLILTLKNTPKEFELYGKKVISPVGNGMCRIVEPFGMGTFETRFKLPKGIGLWIAWWMYENKKEFEAKPEVDMIEAYSDESDYRVTSCTGRRRPWKMESCLHLDEKLKLGQFPPMRPDLDAFNANPSDDFHVYRVKWFPAGLSFNIDDKLVRFISDPDLLAHLAQHKMMVIFNTHIAGGYLSKWTIETPFIIDYFKHSPI